MAAAPAVNGSLSRRESNPPTGLSNGSSIDILNPPSTASTPPGSHSLTDISLEQALARVQELAKENAELRDFMRENNVKMQQQYDALTKWKEKVHEANVVNKEKFEQTRALITALRKENEELQKQASDIQEENRQLQAQLRQLQGEKAGLQRVNIASSHVIQDLREQASEQGLDMGPAEELNSLQENIVHVASAEKEQEIQELETELERVKEELSRVNKRQLELEEENQRFRSSTDGLLMDLESTQKLKKDLQEENQKLVKENLHLSQQLQGILSDTKASFHMDRETATRMLGLEAAAESMATGEQALGEGEALEGFRSLRSDREVSRLERELTGARTDLETAQQDCRDLNQKVQQLQETKESLAEQMQAAEVRHREELTRINQQHEEKLTAMARQQEAPKQMPNDDTYTNDIHTLRSQVLTLISEVNELNNKLSAATSACEKKDQRLKETEQRESQQCAELQNMRHLTARLQSGLNNAQQFLQQERSSHVATKKQMNDLRESFNQLVSDYKELLETFDQYKDQRLLQEGGSHATMDQLSRLTAQVMAAEEALAVRDDQIRKLQEELNVFRKEYDNNVAVLQAQADIYRADFDAERNAREKQVEEKDKIISEMNNLQIRNQQLLDELEGYSRRQLSEMQQRHNNPNNPQAYLQPLGNAPLVYPQHGNYSYLQPGPGVDSPAQGHQAQQHGFPRINQPSQHEELQELECPTCFRHYPDLDTLQLHVIECMDEPSLR